ncbi:serine hydrolase domain-containing protein [Catenuloplanes atrovinosus]|uniref:CubicO group peptidase (Beta-lactamase class C family) n=1 Tax=Catenuloplanes atrovinosus TaxID=137266 RepID=A0AAE3YJ91_9ACTN|nr:serine hydrolase domain-containing protein [Catenuloplanes atrovinosus]MDR7274868.1 CubicO group peptidase (beta-lactamase class C family) [Catenuloplanes atrovinosus]
MDDLAYLTHRAAEFCTDNGIPGYVAGLHRGGERHVVAHGVANTATGAPMRPDTGFLFGSVTKIMTTTLVMRQAERGLIDPDAPVGRYLPALTVPGLRVRHLINHTSGIDADLFFPDEAGRDALKIYLERLVRECGTLFPPGEHVSYSNGGMIVAGRLLEVVTGLSYHDLLARDLFTPAGMTTACTSAEQAILRSTAVGHIPGSGPTRMFMLPPTWAPAGATPIGTVEDLLAFGRVHLGDGAGVLSAESVARMRTITHDAGRPDTDPVGLGWLVRSRAGTTVLTMTGASPGGVAVLIVVPERDLVFAAYGNDPRALTLHDEMLDRLVPAPAPSYAVAPVAGLTRYAGIYRSNQLRVDVRAIGGELEETVTYEPADAAQERILTGFVGGPFAAPPQRYVPVGDDLFAPAGLPLDGLPPYHLVSYHAGAAYRAAGGRMTRRAPA